MQADNAIYEPTPKTITLRYRGQTIECPVLRRGNLVQTSLGDYRWYAIELPNGKTKMVLR